MRFTLSDHAKANMERAHIPPEWVERVMEDPARIEPDRIDPSVSLSMAPIQ